MKSRNSILSIIFLVLWANGFSQPYVDVAAFNYQRFAANYKNDPASNTTDLYALQFLLPKRFNNGSALLCRMNSELIHSQRQSNTNVSSDLSSVSIALGYQWTSASQKWKTTLFAIPKIASDFETPLHEKDWQYGGLFLEEYQFSDKLRVKLGLFANREAFGGFFVPLLGIDWKATDRIYCYGVLPASYKFEYEAVRKKLYTGVQFKSQTRSFRVSGHDQYARFDEVVLKGFVDYGISKCFVVIADLGYSLGKTPLQYHSRSDQLSGSNSIYTQLDQFPVFSAGMAYRIRN